MSSYKNMLTVNKDDLLHAEEILARRETLDLQKESIDRVYREQLTALGLKEHDLRHDCLHLATTYYPDASGNNDSETYCDLCGKEV